MVTFDAMEFDQLVGQNQLRSKLEQTIAANHVSHAQLFAGKLGYGGLPLAMAFAEALLVANSSDQERCRVKCRKLIHPDLHFMFPANRAGSAEKIESSNFYEQWRKAYLANPYLSLIDWMSAIDVENKQGIIRVSQSRELLRFLTLKPYEAACKIALIWLPEKMNLSAANALLKALEEPSQKTIILLVSDNEEQLITTIRSRTQLVRVPPIEENSLKKAVEKLDGVSADRASVIAKLAEGDFSYAQHLAKQTAEDLFNQEQFILWMRHCYSKDFFKVSNWMEGIVKIGRERQKQFFRYGLHIFRECMVMNYGTESLLRLNDQERAFVSKFAPFVNAANAIQLADTFEEAAYHIERNANPKVLYLDVSVKVMKLLTLKP